MNNIKKHRRSTGFTSYITPDDIFEERAVDVPEEPEKETFRPHLLEGEVIISSARHVLKSAPRMSMSRAIPGDLYVTTFKVSFVTSPHMGDRKERELHYRCMQSDFLSAHDLCLSEIGSIYQLSDGMKKKQLHPSSQISSKIEGLHVILKTFRQVNFIFQLTPPGENVKFTKALLHHAFPHSVDLLYLYHVKPPPDCGIPEFCFAQDWEQELQRTRCTMWRVTKHNEGCTAFPSLPHSFVVPTDMVDMVVEGMAKCFKGTRPIVWCWGTHLGAAVVRMAQMDLSTSDTSAENDLMKAVHKSHPKNIQPTVFDLDQRLPSLKAIQTSYMKLKELHTPDSDNAYEDCERNCLSRIEGCGWLSHVMACLELSQMAAKYIAINNSSVILQEGEGRDLSCLVSSLIQLLLDPYARTFRGFHSLIQKEWVALGHPFATRLGHNRHNPDQQSPVWLLFLDCVHHIGLQCPSAFEFSQEYLIAMWQAAHCSRYSTFMFNNVKDMWSTLKFLEKEMKFKPHLWPFWCWWCQDSCERLESEIDSLESERQELLEKLPDLGKVVMPNTSSCVKLRKAPPPPVKGKSGKLERHSSVENGGKAYEAMHSDPVLIGEVNHVTESNVLRKQSRSSSGELSGRKEHEDLRQRLSYIDETIGELNKQRSYKQMTKTLYINKFYVQNLLKNLNSYPLDLIWDPVTITYSIWYRTCYLMNTASSTLPYDPCLPTSDLKVDQVTVDVNGLQPWTECFGRWLTEPELHSESQPVKSRELLEASHADPTFWENLNSIVHTLRQLYNMQLPKNATEDNRKVNGNFRHAH